MPRKKLANPDQLLTRPIVIRVDEATFKRLEKLARESDCQSIGEVARKILTGKRINLFHRDITMHAPMEELARIRKELKAIGVNINQQTRYFHASQNPTERTFYALKTAARYERIENKIDRLLIIVSELAKKWLQK